MKIRKLGSNDMEAYRALAEKEGSVFNSPAWLGMYGGNLQLFGLFDEGGRLGGAFHQYKASKRGMSYYIDPPFTPGNGLFFINRAQNAANRNSNTKGVMQSMAAHFASCGGILLDSAFPCYYKDMQPFTWKKLKASPRYTYRLDLQLSEEQLMDNMAPEKRKSLRKAEKDSISISQCNDYKEVETLVMKTFSRIGKKLNSEMLNKILFSFANKENSFAYVAYNGSEAIAASFCVFDRTTAYYLFGGYDASGSHHGAGVSTMWTSVMQAKKMGLKVFDFEGSMLPVVERYFREFGAELTPFYTVSRKAGWLKLLSGN